MILSIIIVFLTVTALVYSAYYSPTGWSSATGALSADGQAYNIMETGNGYTFFCVGTGTCFQITGNWLEINAGAGSIGGSLWSIFPN